MQKSPFANLFRSQIDLRFGSHRVSTALRADVSRQQSRCFNDLRGPRVPNSATAFDNRHRMVLKEKIPLSKGRPRRQAVRWSGCGSRGRICSPLPGGSGHRPAGTMTGLRGARWTGIGGRRVTPVKARSQEARLELSGGVRSPMQEPRWNAAPDRRGGWFCVCRRSASPLFRGQRKAKGEGE
jgi:hypothetical protein